MRGSLKVSALAQPESSSDASSPPLLKTLLRRSDFLRIQKSAHRWVTPAFVVSCSLPDPSEPLVPQTDIGFTITKKVGNAVVRNRIRRRLRHMVRDILPPLDLKGWQIVLLARPDAQTRDYVDLGKDLRWALRKLREQKAATPPAAPDVATPSATSCS